MKLTAEKKRELVRKLSEDYFLRDGKCNKDEENWLQAEEQLGFSSSGFSEAFARLSEASKPHAQVAGHIVSILSALGIIFTILGEIFLVVYLRSIGAPAVIWDFGLFTLMFAFAFVIAVILVGAFCCPFFLKYLEPSLIEHLTPLFYTRLFRKGPNGGGDTRKFYGAYLRFYLPFLSYVFIWMLLTLFPLPNASAWQGKALLVLFSVVVLFQASTPSTDRIKRSEYLYISLMSNLLSLPWILLLLLLPDWMMTARWASFLFLLVPTGHVLLATVFADYKKGLIFAISLVSFLVLFAVPAQVGAYSLRLLGIGGGKPVSLILKSSPATESKVCLILATSSDVLLYRAVSDQVCISDLLLKTKLPEKNERHIELYQRSEIQRIILVVPSAPKPFAHGKAS